MNSKELALQVAELALEKQALSVEIMDVGQKVDYTDYIVICSGRTDRQVDAIVSEVETTLKKEGVTALGVEGRENNKWVLMDFGEVVVHVFEDITRGFYDLEGLWIDAVRVPIRPVAESR